MSNIYPANLIADSEQTARGFQRRYAKALEDPEQFWQREGQCVSWMRPYKQAKDTSFHKDDFRIRWFSDGQLNLSYNCLYQ